MSKKLLALFCLVFLTMPLSLLAEEIPVAILSMNEDGKTKTLTFTYAEESLATAKKGETGIYKLSISGTPDWNSNKLYVSPKPDSITTVVFDKSFSNARPKSTYRWFYYMTQLTEIRGIENLNTSEVTMMEEMFLNCNSLKSIDVSHFNTSNVKDMDRMFTNCSALTTLDISNFNLDNLQSIYAILLGCSSLNTLNVGKNDFSKLTSEESTGRAFQSVGYRIPCYLITADGFNFQVLGNKDEDNLYTWHNGHFTINKTISVPGAQLTTNENDKSQTLTFKYIDLDVTKANADTNNKYFVFNRNLYSQSFNFGNRAAITKVVIDKTFKDIKPKSTASWFSKMTNLRNIEGMENLNTSQTEDMSNMFSNCSSLENIDLSHMNTDNVSKMYYMFIDCTSLKEIDISNFNMQKVETVIDMFYNCTSLRKLNIGANDFSNLDNSAKYYTFEDVGKIMPCYLIVSDDFKISELGEKNSLGTYDWLSGNFTLSPVINLPVANITTNADGKTKTMTFSYKTDIDVTQDVSDDMFAINTLTHPAWINLRTDNSDITSVVFEESFKQARPASTKYWFYRMTNLKEIVGLENLNTSDVKYMECMFSGCSNLTSLDISHFVLNKTNNITRLLYGCRNLTELNIGSLDFKDINYKDSLFGYVGTAEKPCNLIVNASFNRNVLGNKQGTGNGYYIWECGYFAEPKDITEGIDNTFINGNDNGNAPRYNLSGQRIDKAYKGIVISRGKKYINK